MMGVRCSCNQRSNSKSMHFEVSVFAANMRSPARRKHLGVGFSLDIREIGE